MEVIITPFAESNLIDLYQKVADEFGPIPANNLELKVRSILKEIADLPFMYPVEFSKRGHKIHKAVVMEKTIIAYEVDEQAKIIYVIDAFDARTDWK